MEIKETNWGMLLHFSYFIQIKVPAINNASKVHEAKVNNYKMK